MNLTTKELTARQNNPTTARYTPRTVQHRKSVKTCDYKKYSLKIQAFQLILYRYIYIFRGLNKDDLTLSLGYTLYFEDIRTDAGYQTDIEYQRQDIRSNPNYFVCRVQQNMVLKDFVDNATEQLRKLAADANGAKVIDY